jgi:hypothetical protein
MRVPRTLVAVGITLVALAVAGPAGAAVVDPERNSSAITGWWWYYGQTEAQINSIASSNGARVTDIEVQSTSPHTFAATFVQNAGPYARGWWWYYNLTSAQVAQKISEHGARLIDIERYTVGGERRFAIVLVQNTGDAAKTWWYYYDVTAATLASKLSQNNARLVDLESYTVGDAQRFSAVMIRNTGVDAKAWWWYYNATPAFVASKLSANSARLIDVDRRSNGNLDVVMQRRGSEYWWWYYDLTASGLAKVASQNGARVAEIETYVKSGTRRFAVLLLNNVNSETSRLRQIMKTGLNGGSYGIYLKRVGGSTVVNLQGGTVFEPASSIKVVHHLYTMRQIATGPDTLGSTFYYYVKPGDTSNKDVCPDTAWESNVANRRTTTIQDGLNKMMQVSDNRTTRGVVIRYGFPALNTMAQTTIGMSNTALAQNVGCGFKNGLRNNFTLVDAGKLYEGVSNGSLLSGTTRDSFWSIMLGGTVAAGTPLATIVSQEATKLGKSAAVATSFRQNMNQRSKGGSYDICGSSCNPYTYYRSAAGRITIPFKSGATIVPTDYVYGRFVDGLTIPCAVKSASETTAQAEARCAKYKAANKAMNDAGTELFRSVIRAALQTW